jgi:hypothetical protein
MPQRAGLAGQPSASGRPHRQAVVNCVLLQSGTFTQYFFLGRMIAQFE